MPNLTPSAVDRHNVQAIRRVRPHHLRRLTVQQALQVRRDQAISTEQPMHASLPELAWLNAVLLSQLRPPVRRDVALLNPRQRRSAELLQLRRVPPRQRQLLLVQVPEQRRQPGLIPRRQFPGAVIGDGIGAGLVEGSVQTCTAMCCQPSCLAASSVPLPASTRPSGMTTRGRCWPKAVRDSRMAWRLASGCTRTLSGSGERVSRRTRRTSGARGSGGAMVAAFPWHRLSTPLAWVRTPAEQVRIASSPLMSSVRCVRGSQRGTTGE